MAAFIPLALGAAGGALTAGANRRNRRQREARLQAFLRAFFPQSIPGGKFASNFLAQGNNRIGLNQTNLSNQLLQLLGQRGNLGGGLQAGGQGAILVPESLEGAAKVQTYKSIDRISFPEAVEFLQKDRGYSRVTAKALADSIFSHHGAH